jgi:hypothetical protein
MDSEMAAQALLIPGWACLGLPGASAMKIGWLFTGAALFVER